MSYKAVQETAEYTLGVFCLEEAGAAIPLHDHPHMAVRRSITCSAPLTQLTSCSLLVWLQAGRGVNVLGHACSPELPAGPARPLARTGVLTPSGRRACPPDP